MPVKAGVVRVGDKADQRGAAETFTGTVFQDPVLVARRRRGWAGRSSPSRRGRAPPGTPIRSARRSIAFRESGICFEGEKPQVLTPAIRQHSARYDAFGTAPRRPACSRIWRCPRPASRARAPDWGKHVSDAEYTRTATAG